MFFRDDLNHPIVVGNKLHKLSPNLALAEQLKCDSVLSFGGPYSNHLHALAWACQQRGLASIGLVRGELHSSLTPTLTDCQRWGMQLVAVQRQFYRSIQDDLFSYKEPCFAHQLIPTSIVKTSNNTLVVPEGGSNRLAIDSLSDAYRPIFEQDNHRDITHVVCATGTGATLAGLYRAAPEGVTVLGVQAVAEGQATFERICNWLREKPRNLIITEGHLGGFAKIPDELTQFIDDFEQRYGVPLDPIYNGKVLFRLAKMVKQGNFDSNQKILIIHTGGLQGSRQAYRVG